ncbi:gamma-aminobutyric acid type b receptor subunit 1 [Plakobranchus ocellatus]|uniref:Gamma-aminobutyric acid type b receptor subunit 1 n=1 Tax=Plakobranchus ocellatus TaxID=259542 RepID=A0AAV3YYG5_9GAST|nr:gamma-aminobutyric acid type b receptor subunit 1 [Plakobranchus ocellatus]
MDTNNMEFRQQKGTPIQQTSRISRSLRGTSTRNSSQPGLWSKFLHILISLVISCDCENSSDVKTPLYVGGLWPMTGPGWRGGLEALPAIELAVEVLNNNTEILPGHEVKLIWNDTQVVDSLSNLFMMTVYFNNAFDKTKVF